MTDPLIAAARFLLSQMEWLRHAADAQGGPYALGVFDEIGESARRIRRLVDGPAAQKYLGPCGAGVPQPPEGEPDLPCCVATQCPPHAPPCCVHGDPVHCPADPYVGLVRCDGDVYARGGASVGRCRTCGAEWSTAERVAWLDGQVRASSFRASEIEDAYGVSANLIRQWATPERQLVRVHDRDFLGRARYMLGEVLDVAAGQAAKRAEAQAKRARRVAEQEASTV